MTVGTPEISVLMAVYNAPAHYLDAAIESILSQSFSDFEFIVVDDGSDLATRNRLQYWAQHDQRICLYHQETNVGLTRALNVGLKLTRGAYVARQDADDISAPDRLAIALEFLHQYPDVDAVGTNAVLIDKNDRQIGLTHIDPDLKGLSQRNILVHGSMMFRRSVFEKLGGYDERMRLSQDYELYLRMLRLHGMHLRVLSVPLYSLRQHSEALSRRRVFRQLYFSVLAKTLTEKNQPGHWGWVRFYKVLAFDFIITHRMFLGTLVRGFQGSKLGDHHSALIKTKKMMNNFQVVSHCRMCGNDNLVGIVDLGEQYLTGIFPRTNDADRVTKGPLQLVKCHSDSKEVCGLVQLRHTYDAEAMYGDNYGYRSGLNGSMVAHLQHKIGAIMARVALCTGDIVIDIGSNDGTSLAAYPENLIRVGIDPVGMKFKDFYPAGATLIPALFSSSLLAERFPGRKAKVITSFSMMYDLEDPLLFVREVADLLDPDSGLWVFEQSYLPLMLEKMAFDTICHEHIEYYGLKQIEWLLDRAGLKIVDVDFNDVNGGSFSVMAAHKIARYQPATGLVSEALLREEGLGLGSLEPYSEFAANIESACTALKQFLLQAKQEGKRVCGLGASTKGNVLLQHCGLTANDIEMIGEINPDKFGAVTPGTWIPIEDEAKVLASKPDYLLVLPWHFRESFLSAQAYKGHHLVFPLPSLEVVSV